MAGGHAEGPGNKLDVDPASRRRQLRLEAVRDEAPRSSRGCSREGHRAAREVRRGPHRQHRQLRPPRLGPRLRRRARADARRHHARASRSTSSTTTAPTSSSASATTATRWRRSSGPTGSGASSTGVRAVLTNKCQQGAYRGFGSEVNNWMLERIVDKAAARARPRPGRDPPAGTSSAGRVPVLHPDRQRLRLRRLRAPCSTRRSSWPTTTTGAPSRRRRARRAATSASAWSPPRSAASSARPSSGSGSTSRARRSPRCPRA